MKTIQNTILGLFIIFSTSLMAQITITETHMDNLCSDNIEGEINITVTGGALPYSYEWSYSNSGFIHSSNLTNEDQFNLHSGTYTVIVTDNSSNTETLTIDILDLYSPLLIDSLTQLSNFGWFSVENTGECVIHVSGGALPYSYYTYHNGVEEELVDSLALGLNTQSSIKVIDNVGCVKSEYMMMHLDTVSFMQSDATNGLCNGNIMGAGFYGEPVEYIWSNGVLLDENLYLCPGEYTVTLTSPERSVDYSQTFEISPTFNNLYTFVDTLNITVETCILDNQASIDSAFIFDYHFVSSDSVITNWAIWQDGDSSTINVGLNITNSGNNLVYLDVICNSKSMNETNTYSFYGMFNATGVGIDKVKKEDAITIYPNPAKDYFTINLDNSEKSDLKVLDITGKVIYQDNFSEEIIISTEVFKRGIYVVKIKNNDNIIIRKIIVE